MPHLPAFRRAVSSFCAVCLLIVGALLTSSSFSLPGTPTLWVSDGSSTAWQVDTQNHSLVASLALPDDVRNLAVDPYDGSLWVLTTTRLLQISATGVVQVDTSLATYFAPGVVDFRVALNPYGGNLWVAGGNTLLRLNPLGAPDVITQLPATIKQISLGQDETLVVLTQTELLKFSPAGQVLDRRSLASLGLSQAKLDGVVADTLGQVVWLSGPRVLARLDTSVANALPVTIQTASTPQAQFISPLALDAFTGTVWIANSSTVFSFDRQGQALAPIQLATWNLKMPRSLAFEPQSQTLWVGANGGTIAHFTRTGVLLGTLDAGNTGRPIFGVAPAQILPTLTLESPASGSRVNTAFPPITLTLGTSCNGNPCSLDTVDLSTLTLNIDINGQAIPPGDWTITGNDATWTPSAALTEGTVTLDGTATDALNHISATLHDSFIVDLPPVISITAPVDGALTNDPHPALTGFVNEPVTLTVNGATVPLSSPDNAFDYELSLNEGNNDFHLVAVDAGGNTSTKDFSVTLDSTPPEAPGVTLGELTDGQVPVSGTAEAGSTVTVTNLSTNASTQVTAGADGTFSATLAAQAGDSIRVTVTDPAGNTSTATDSDIPNPPSGPVLNPSVIDPTVPSNVATTTAFLYSGADPIQTGVVPGAIEPIRAAVLRGKVMARDNTPLAGVTISIRHHSELGQTITRADGLFDMAVNGGGLLTIDYVKTGFLPVQRQLDVPWQDFALADDVVMIPLDTQVTTITANAGTMQVARGSTVTDDDGTRTATVFFPAGTTASMILPDGSLQPLTTLSVRATEYTVGDNGPLAMPASLPPMSAYTYAVALTVDEALANGIKVAGKDVLFNQPVPVYVDNFLNFPVGGAVPAGYQDPDASAWIPEPDGRVIKIISIVNGRAQLDTNGDGQIDTAAQLAALNISDDEQVQLATLYAAGKTLWRVPIAHFSWHDFNWPWGLPGDAAEPAPGKPEIPGAPAGDPCEGQGSIIECQNRVLGERIGVVGTPFSLDYRSDRSRDHKSNVLEIPLSGSTIPASVVGIRLQVIVAGRVFGFAAPPMPNQSKRFEWDGKDAYGRLVQGSQPVTVRVGYVYPAVSRSAGGTQSVASFGGAGGGKLNIVIRSDGGLFTLWNTTRTHIGSWHAAGQQLGGWTLSPHHGYDPHAKTLYLGNGERRSPKVAGTVVVRATKSPHVGRDVDTAPDGTAYIADQGNSRIWKRDPSGVVTLFAGTGTAGFLGDGGQATLARVNTPAGVAVAPDGSVYIADTGNFRIRKVTPDGIIRTVAGTGSMTASGSVGPATSVAIGQVFGVAVAADGSVYFAQRSGARVRKIDPDGIVTTVAGTGTAGFSGDGGLATQARISGPDYVDVATDGSLYIAEEFNHRIRKVTPDGVITTVAGNGTAGFGGDGGPAVQASMNSPHDIAAAPDGGFFFVDTANDRVRHVAADGTITTVAGNGVGGNLGDNAPPTQAQLNAPWGLAVSPDGGLYIAESTGGLGVRKIVPALPGFTAADTLIASEDGSELYHFDVSGRHLRTLDTHTGATRYTFGYTNALLTSITDGDGDITQIERDPAGRPTAIVSADGHRTMLTLDGNGYFASVANPAGDTHRMQYTANGLLTSFTDPREHASVMQYNADGLLLRDENAADGFWDLSGSEDLVTRLVTMTSAEGRTTQYRIDDLASGNELRTNTFADGTVATSLLKTDGTTQTTTADGTVSTTVEGPDPRWGMRAPLIKSSTVQVPSGLTSTTTTTRAAVLANAADPMSLTSETTTTTVNGRAFVTTYTASNRQYSFKSPLNRVTTVRTDVLGRPVFSQLTGIDATNYSYDTRGRLQTVTQGSGVNLRSLTYTYGADGFVNTITDAQNRQTLYQRDLAGRITSTTLPGNRIIGTGYDSNGNVTSITPPSKPTHAFDYTTVDLAEQYTPPTVAGVSTPQTQYAYNRDKQLTTLTRPDDVTLAYGYDTAGRLQTITPSANGDILTYGYHATSGQLASLATPTQTLAYLYDGLLLKDEMLSGMVSGTISRTYDASLRTTGIAVNGSNVTLAYDNDDLLTGTGSLTLTRNTQNGLLTGTTLGGATTANTYNTFGELATFTAKYGATTQFATTYTYDTLGRIATKAETVQGVTSNYVYGYDLAGRLQTVTKNGVTVESYTYDANGNRNGGTYNDQDRLLSYSGNTYTYTASGELDTKTNVGGTTNYDYDVYGNLKAVALPGGTQIAYLTDGRNRRIGKVVNGTQVQGFLYQDQLRIAAELDTANNIVSRFVYGTKVNVPDYMTKSGTTYRIVTDHLGSVRLAVNTSSGSVVQRMDYDSYGNVTNDTNPGFQPFGFAGGLYDRDTKLTRLGARDYDAETGRWTTRDPIGFNGGDTNVYAYVGNNPINSTDPSGLLSVDVDVPGIGTVPIVRPEKHDVAITLTPTSDGVDINISLDKPKPPADKHSDDFCETPNIDVPIPKGPLDKIEDRLKDVSPATLEKVHDVLSKYTTK